MIYTLTLAPSLDYFVKVENFEAGKVNRAFSSKFVAGGKGINVSLTLKSLNKPSTAIVAFGGEVGQNILAELKEKGINTIGIRVKGESRVNIKVNSQSETAINLPSPVLDEESFAVLYKTILDIPSESFFIISGRLSGIITPKMMEKMMEATMERHLKVILDISDPEFVSAFNYHPFLIKPNLEEIKVLSFTDIFDSESMIKSCSKLHEQGVQRIIISLGKLGAFYYENSFENFFIQTHQVETTNTVGAGDALIGAFISEYEKNDNSRQALEKAVSYVADKLYKNSLEN